MALNTYQRSIAAKTLRAYRKIIRKYDQDAQNSVFKFEKDLNLRMANRYDDMLSGARDMLDTLKGRI